MRKVGRPIKGEEKPTNGNIKYGTNDTALPAAGGRLSPMPMVAAPEPSGSPSRAYRSKGWQVAALLRLVLDTCFRMAYGKGARGDWRNGFDNGGLGKAGGDQRL